MRALPIVRNRRAVDAEIEDEKVREMVNFLRKKLSPEDFKTLKALVGVGEEMGEDQPAPFAGMPRPGGTMVAADAAPRDYASRFPGAARISVWL